MSWESKVLLVSIIIWFACQIILAADAVVNLFL